MKLPTVAALATCVVLATACSHSTRTPNAANASAGTAAALAYANCMRSHGIADFPDPDSGGQIDLKSAAEQGGASTDLAVASPRFQAAASACQSLQPTESTTQQYQDAAHALHWARCMRTHGIIKFPDPDSDGGFHVAAIRADGVDVTTPQFAAAATACEQYQPSDILVPGGSGAP